MVDHWSVCNVCIYFSLEANTRSRRRGRLLRLHNNQAPVTLLRAKWFTQLVAPAFIIWGEWPPHNYVIPENLGQDAWVFIPEPPLYVGTTILLLPREGAGPPRNTVQTLPLRSLLWVTPAWTPGRWGKRPPENPSHHLSSHLKPLTSQLRPRASWTRGNPSQLSPAWISDYRIWEQNKNSWFKLFNFRGIFNAEIATEIVLF